MNRLQERRRWVVSFPILRPFFTETVPSTQALVLPRQALPEARGLSGIGRSGFEVGRPQVRPGLVVAVRPPPQVLRKSAAVVCGEVFVRFGPEAGGTGVVYRSSDD